MKSPAVSVKGVSKSFGSHLVLDHVSLDVSWGEVVAILGQNGAGKTTLLESISGFLRPDEGLVLLGGEEARKAVRAAASFRIGVLAAASCLYSELSIQENLELFSKLGRPKNSTSKESSVEIGTLLETFSLGDHREKLPRECSQGILRRASIVRSLVGSPDILLLDEPSSNLDEQGLQSLIEAISAVRKRGGAVIFASHDRPFIESVSDRVLELSLGRVRLQFDSSTSGAEKELVV